MTITKLDLATLAAQGQIAFEESANTVIDNIRKDDPTGVAMTKLEDALNYVVSRKRETEVVTLWADTWGKYSFMFGYITYGDNKPRIVGGVNYSGPLAPRYGETEHAWSVNT